LGLLATAFVMGLREVMVLQQNKRKKFQERTPFPRFHSLLNQEALFGEMLIIIPVLGTVVE
jgi:hypothetical protein